MIVILVLIPLSILIAAGKKAGVKVLRDGKEMQLTVTVDRLKEKEGEGETAAQVPDKLGMSVSELNGELAAHMGIAEAKGVVVVDVKPMGVSEKAEAEKSEREAKIKKAVSD
jgi:S1-C subfamily serine protease